MLQWKLVKGAGKSWKKEMMKRMMKIMKKEKTLENIGRESLKENKEWRKLVYKRRSKSRNKKEISVKRSL